MRRGIILLVVAMTMVQAASAASTSVQLSAPSGQACPTGSAEYRVHIANTADIEQRYTVSTDFPGATIAPQHLSVAPGASDSSYLWLQVPDDMQPGTYRFTVDVRSGTLEKTHTVKGTLDVLSCRAVSVDIAQPEQNVCRGGTATYDVTVTNTGNVEETYTLEASSGTLSTTEVTLAPGESVSITLTRSSMDTADEDISVSASSTSSYAADTAVAHFTAERCRNVALHLTPDTRTVCENEAGTFTATVTNTGSITDSYHVAVNRPDVTSRSITLAPNETTSLDITTMDAVGKHTVAVRVQSKSYDPLVRSRDATLAVENCYDLGMSVPTTRTLQLETGNTTLLTAQLTNTGTEENTYTLRTAGPDWIRVQPHTVTLAPGASSSAYIYVAPDYFSQGSYEARLLVSDASGEVNRAVDINVTVGENTVTAETGGVVGLTGRFLTSRSGVLGIIVVAAILLLLYALTIRNSVKAVDTSPADEVPSPPADDHQGQDDRRDGQRNSPDAGYRY